MRRSDGMSHNVTPCHSATVTIQRHALHGIITNCHTVTGLPSRARVCVRAPACAPDHHYTMVTGQHRKTCDTVTIQTNRNSSNNLHRHTSSVTVCDICDIEKKEIGREKK
jgi:hypothetical protein